MATIYDIAKLSNTSAATVSYVLNGKGDERRISQKTQKAVLEVAERLNYRPDVSAKNLRTKGYKGLRICLFWPEFYFEQSMVATMNAIREVTKWSVDPVEVSIQFFQLDHFQEKWESNSWQMFNGLMICGLSAQDMDYLQTIEFPIPVVLINRRLGELPHVGVDPSAAGKMAADYICSTGIASVMAILLGRYHLASSARQHAFVECCEQRGLDLKNRQYFCNSTADSAYELTLQLIQSKAIEKIVFCGSEEIARGVATALMENGYMVGRDVYLLHFNNGPLSLQRYFFPSLAGISLMSQRVYEEALKMCISLVTRREIPSRQLTIQPEIRSGASFPFET